ncbi:unnamed protein product [Arabidopsis halleri]
MSRNESTAVVSVVTPEKTIVSKCGDSRDVLCRDGVASPLSVDHKPDRPDELIRIQQAGHIYLKPYDDDDGSEMMDYGTLYQMRRRYGMARVCLEVLVERMVMIPLQQRHTMLALMLRCY